MYSRKKILLGSLVVFTVLILGYVSINSYRPVTTEPRVYIGLQGEPPENLDPVPSDKAIINGVTNDEVYLQRSFVRDYASENSEANNKRFQRAIEELNTDQCQSDEMKSVCMTQNNTVYVNAGYITSSDFLTSIVHQEEVKKGWKLCIGGYNYAESYPPQYICSGTEIDL